MSATIIVDSGSTSADWRAFAGSEIIFETQSSGLNPLYLSEDELRNEIDKNLKPYLGFQEIKRVYFFGAGCNTTENQMRIQNVLSLFFPESIFHIASDLDGAAMGLFGKDEGIACIMGTGSNACHWDGKTILQKVPSLGFIIGDEGSGAWIGKQVAADYIRGMAPEEIQSLIAEEYPKDIEFFQKKVYQSNYASRFLAHIGGLIGLLPNHPYTQTIYRSAFHAFHNRFISSYKNMDLEYGFIGGIAITMKNIIEEESAKLGLKIRTVSHKPVDGIQDYLKKELYPEGR
ncbi:MAG: hypothetical protein C0592_01050 [Marinilabiliales bacterium]|nr:MAG: hypothetical protein C0592_01050 [Marinilabiliales bacterium]